MVNLDAELQAVLVAPEADAPRLAYADAVSSTDPARSELIRLQLDLARWRREGRKPPSPDAALLREGDLLRAHQAAWTGSVRGLVQRAVLLRGFAEWVALPARKFLAEADELYRRAPILHLDLSEAKPVADALSACPALARIRSLSLVGNALGDGEISALARSPHLAKLRWLDLRRNRIGLPGLEALVTALPDLAYVNLEDNDVPDPAPFRNDGYDSATAVAEQLQATHGSRRWLRPFVRPVWPPDRDVYDVP